MYDFDAPELFGYKVLYPEVTVYYEAQSRELT